ncbi:MAG: DUF4097 family beta strand repeat-containing protein [Chthoniobacterales bacterium]
MNTRIALLLLLSAATGWAVTEENVNQQFTVTPGGKLVVEVDFGTIDVTVGSDTELVVQGKRKIESDDKARETEYVAAAPITATQEGSTVTLRARRAKDRSPWNWSGHMEMDAEYTVRVPKNFNVDLKTHGGAISASGVTGEVVANTSGGNIALVECAGALTVSTNGGSIDSQNGKGSLNARTSGGSIAVRDFGGDAQVRTSGGKLTLENIAGAVSGKTSAGSITVSLADPVPGDVQLQTSAGSIDLTLSEKAAVSVNAKTGMGSIRTEIPMLATRSRDNRLEGTLNGGGKSILLNASIGSINIRPNPPPTVAR